MNDFIIIPGISRIQENPRIPRNSTNFKEFQKIISNLEILKNSLNSKEFHEFWGILRNAMKSEEF